MRIVVVTHEEPFYLAHLMERLIAPAQNPFARSSAIGYFEKGEVPRFPNDESRATYFSYPTRENVRRFRARGRSFL